jgi:hypothetical protein
MVDIATEGYYNEVFEHMEKSKTVLTDSTIEAGKYNFLALKKMRKIQHMVCRPVCAHNKTPGCFQCSWNADTFEWTDLYPSDALDHYTEPDDLYAGDKTWRLP